MIYLKFFIFISTIIMANEMDISVEVIIVDNNSTEGNAQGEIRTRMTLRTPYFKIDE